MFSGLLGRLFRYGRLSVTDIDVEGDTVILVLSDGTERRVEFSSDSQDSILELLDWFRVFGVDFSGAYRK